MEQDGVIQVTGFTPDPNAQPASDMQEQSPAAPPAEDAGEAQPGDNPADSEQHEDPTSQATDAHTDGQQQQRKPSRGVQKALDRLTDRATSAERTAAQLATALAAMQGHQQYQPQQHQPAPQPVEKPLAVTDFGSWEEYSQEVARREARQEASKIVEANMRQFVGALVQSTQQNAQQQEVQAMNSRIAQATAKAPERIADWDDVVASDLPMTPVLHRAIAQADDPAAVMHYLATHPDEHMKLVRMNPIDQAYAAGRIFAGQRGAVVSNAPAPARPVGGRASSPGGSGYRDDFTPAQHKAWLARQTPRG